MFRSPSRKILLCTGSENRAFTLIELLAVIAIIAILAALLIGSVSKIRDMARRSTCSSNLRQIGAAFQLYAADNHGFFPAPRLIEESKMPAPYTKTNPPPWANPSLDNWQAEVSRYVLRDQLIGSIKATDSSSNIAHCPSYDLLFSDANKLTSTIFRTAGYGMNVNINVGGVNLNTSFSGIGASGNTITIPGIARRFLVSAFNYPAKTVLVGDSSDYHLGFDTVTWTFANNDSGKPDGYNSGAPTRHGSNANYLYADGHIAALSPDAALVALRFIP